MSDYSSASILSSAGGQQDATIQTMKMQFQAEQQVAGIAAQSANQTQNQNQTTSAPSQPALKTSGPKGTQVNMVV
jgi:hypothetical protein